MRIACTRVSTNRSQRLCLSSLMGCRYLEIQPCVNKVKSDPWQSSFFALLWVSRLKCPKICCTVLSLIYLLTNDLKLINEQHYQFTHSWIGQELKHVEFLINLSFVQNKNIKKKTIPRWKKCNIEWCLPFTLPRLQACLYIRGRVLLGLLLSLGDVPERGGDDGHLRRHGRPWPWPHLPPGHRLCRLLLRAKASPRYRWEKIYNQKLKMTKIYVSRYLGVRLRGRGLRDGSPSQVAGQHLRLGGQKECREFKYWWLSVTRLQSSCSREYASAAYFSGDW